MMSSRPGKHGDSEQKRYESETEYRRGSADAGFVQSGREKQLGDAKLKPRSAQRDKNRNRRSHSRRSVPSALARARFVAYRLANSAFARLLHLRPHGVQIIGGGNYRKKQNQRASQREQVLERALTIHVRSAAGLAPQTVSGYNQQQPDQIEEQFHFRQNQFFRKLKS
jgi:hypothetical protein